MKTTNNRIKTFLLASAMSGLLVACSSGNSYVDSRDNEPSYEEITTQQDFAVALQDAYFDHATHAYDTGDTVSADYYALRSIMAAEGKIVNPSELSTQELGENYPVAREARNRLMRQFDRGARVNTPHVAARAQASFDCWLRETAKKDVTKAKICRSESITALKLVEATNVEGARRVASTRPFALTQTDVPVVKIDVPQTVQAPEARTQNTEVKGMVVENEDPIMTSEDPIMSTNSSNSFNDMNAIQTASIPTQGDVSFISPLMRASMPRKGDYAVYFGFDSSEITMEAEDILIDIIQEAKNRDASTIVIMGHADTIGSSQYNNLLSLRRAQEVRKFLTEQLPEGISYRVAALGESNPVIGVGDRISQTANRRVEVEFE